MFTAPNLRIATMFPTISTLTIYTMDPELPAVALGHLRYPCLPSLTSVEIFHKVSMEAIKLFQSGRLTSAGRMSARVYYTELELAKPAVPAKPTGQKKTGKAPGRKDIVARPPRPEDEEKPEQIGAWHADAAQMLRSIDSRFVRDTITTYQLESYDLTQGLSLQ